MCSQTAAATTTGSQIGQSVRPSARPVEMCPAAYHAHDPPRNTDWSATASPLATHNSPASVTFGYFRLLKKTPTGVEYNKPQPTRGGNDIIFLSLSILRVNRWSDMKICLYHRRRHSSYV
jgi:hypothetical protein